jgi:hypothetical protein
MFAATPRLRDLLDLRTVLLVAVVALVAFGLQLTFLAGTVASPLGEAIANLETIPQFQTTSAGQALAGADDGRDPRPAITRDAYLPWERPARVWAAHRPVEQACLVYW